MMKNLRNKNKVTIIGAGFVGATTAYSLLHQSDIEELALIDINKKLVDSQVMDLQHSLPVLGYTEVKVGTEKDLADSGVVIFACGCNQKIGESRLDLVEKNARIVKEWVPKIFTRNPNAVLVMITNPVDILTHLAVSLFPKKKNQIFGSGTILDSMRLQFLVGEYLGIDPQSVHAYIAGEHGDSELPLWSSATIGGQKLTTFKKFNRTKFQQLFEQARNAAYAIIEGKQATYYGIGAGAAHLVNAIVMNKKTVLPVSYYLAGEYGLRDVCLSMPAVIGENGIMEKLSLELSSEEKKLLAASALSLKRVYRSCQKQISRS